jgi:hypothetical protein
MAQEEAFLKPFSNFIYLVRKLKTSDNTVAVVSEAHFQKGRSAVRHGEMRHRTVSAPFVPAHFGSCLLPSVAILMSCLAPSGEAYRIRAELMLAFWGSIGFIPDPYMVGMKPSSRLV